MERSKLFFATLTVCGAFAVTSHAGGDKQKSSSGQSSQSSQTQDEYGKGGGPVGSPSTQGMQGHEGHDMSGQQQQQQQQGMQGMQGQRMSPQQISQFIQSWPEASRMAAMSIMNKYGQPNEMTQSMLIWNNAGQFKRTVVYKDAVDHNFPYPHQGVLEQVIDYKVPVDRYDDIARFNGSVVPDRTRGELAARSNSEELNILALNLADQVATGQRSVQNAREFFGRIAMQLPQPSLQPGQPGQPLPGQQPGQQTAQLPREATILLVDLTREDTEDRDVAVRGQTQRQRTTP